METDKTIAIDLVEAFDNPESLIDFEARARFIIITALGSGLLKGDEYEGVAKAYKIMCECHDGEIK